MAEALGKKLPAELDLVTLRKAYARWAPVYDLVFGALFDRGRQAAIAAAERVGGRILEVGVGTGISLPGYSSENRIIGIDLSDAMLRKAQRRVADLSLTYVEQLEVMDAEHLSFQDASFDVVVANILANPLELLAPLLAQRVRVGGRVVLSGILQSQSERVAAAYARWFNIAPWGSGEGWVALAGVRLAP